MPRRHRIGQNAAVTKPGILARVHRPHVGWRIERKILSSVLAAQTFPTVGRPSILRRSGVEVGPGCRFFHDLSFRPGKITIGEHVFINSGCVLDPGASGITIGDRMFLRVGVILAADSHSIGPSNHRARDQESAPITIGEGSWIGARVTVLSGVTGATGCVVGAGYAEHSAKRGLRRGASAVDARSRGLIGRDVEVNRDR